MYCNEITFLSHAPEIDYIAGNFQGTRLLHYFSPYLHCIGICRCDRWIPVQQGPVCSQDLCFHGNIGEVIPPDPGRLGKENN